VLFVIPWGRHWIIGTTDTDWELGKAHPAASAADIDYLLDHVNAVLEVPLTHEDVEGVYAGLRPLLSGESESTSKLSREHAVAHTVPGLVVVAGGKYTTYRIMAKDAVDAAAHAMDAKVPPSVTQDVPLLGAEGYAAMKNSRYLLAHRYGLHVARIEHLLGRYGSLISEVLDLVEQDPTLGEQLAGAPDYLRAEVVYAAVARGRPAPGGRPRPPHPDLDRDLRPGHRVGGGGGPAHGAGARLERGADRARGGALPQARRGERSRVPEDARRRDRRVLRMAPVVAHGESCPCVCARAPVRGARRRRATAQRRRWQGAPAALHLCDDTRS
jgi:hypothetical protein